MNIIKLITDASVVVQFILLLLLFFSVFSWAIIIFKRRMLRGAAAQSQKFLNAFHRSKNLSEVGEAARKYKLSPHAALFQAGYKELVYFTNSNPNVRTIRTSSARVIRSGAGGMEWTCRSMQMPRFSGRASLAERAVRASPARIPLVG